MNYQEKILLQNNQILQSMSIVDELIDIGEEIVSELKTNNETINLINEKNTIFKSIIDNGKKILNVMRKKW